MKNMENNPILTPQQITFLQRFSQSDLTKIFRFGGGTALSAFYLEHRDSDDLDFFSPEKIPFYRLDAFLKDLDFVAGKHYTSLFDRAIFQLTLKDRTILKVDFAYYPLDVLEPPVTVDGLQVESFMDIVIGKMCAMADRREIKDYVDLYVAMRRRNLDLSHLLRLAEQKCRIPGVSYTLQAQLQSIPEGIALLRLREPINPDAMKGYFKEQLKSTIHRTLDEDGHGPK